MKTRVFAAGAIVAAAIAATPAQAQMAVKYFTVQDNNRDFSGTGASGSFTNALASTLGPNGMPVITAGNPLNAVDYNAVTKELYWWTPGAPNINVVATGTGVIAGNSFTDTTFFPTNGAGSSNGGQNGFQTAIFSGNFVLNAAQSVLFSISADDDAFLFVDGVSALQNGGIHAATTQNANVNLGAGAHSFVLFYADRQEVDAQLSFSLPANIVITSGVPEPATWAMMVLGFGAMGGALRRRQKVVTRIRFA
jgi:hypothetical protein